MLFDYLSTTAITLCIFHLSASHRTVFAGIVLCLCLPFQCSFVTAWFVRMQQRCDGLFSFILLFVLYRAPLVRARSDEPPVEARRGARQKQSWDPLSGCALFALRGGVEEAECWEFPFAVRWNVVHQPPLLRTFSPGLIFVFPVPTFLVTVLLWTQYLSAPSRPLLLSTIPSLRLFFVPYPGTLHSGWRQDAPDVPYGGREGEKDNGGGGKDDDNDGAQEGGEAWNGAGTTSAAVGQAEVGWKGCWSARRGASSRRGGSEVEDSPADQTSARFGDSGSSRCRRVDLLLECAGGADAVGMYQDGGDDEIDDEEEERGGKKVRFGAVMTHPKKLAPPMVKRRHKPAMPRVVGRKRRAFCGARGRVSAVEKLEVNAVSRVLSYVFRKECDVVSVSLKRSLQLRCCALAEGDGGTGKRRATCTPHRTLWLVAAGVRVKMKGRWLP